LLDQETFTFSQRTISLLSFILAIFIHTNHSSNHTETPLKPTITSTNVLDICNQALDQNKD